MVPTGSSSLELELERTTIPHISIISTISTISGILREVARQSTTEGELTRTKRHPHLAPLSPKLRITTLMACSTKVTSKVSMS